MDVNVDFLMKSYNTLAGPVCLGIKDTLVLMDKNEDKGEYIKVTFK